MINLDDQKSNTKGAGKKSKSVGNTHALRALTALREKILRGSLPAGMRLLEVPLSEELEVSRTPVRDAMARLAEEGLLDRAKNGGFIVRTFGISDVVDAIELRGVLEGTAARLSAERGVDTDHMQELLTQLDECFMSDGLEVDFGKYSDKNAEFHAALASLSGSDIIRRELERATRLPFASPSAFLTEREMSDRFARSLVVAQDQHRALVNAIAAREGARAEAITREHARAAFNNFQHMLSEQHDGLDSKPGLALSLV